MMHCSEKRLPKGGSEFCAMQRKSEKVKNEEVKSSREEGTF